MIHQTYWSEVVFLELVGARAGLFSNFELRFFFLGQNNQREETSTNDRPPIPCKVAAKCASSFFIQPSTKTNSSPSIHNLTSFNNDQAGQALVGPPQSKYSALNSVRNLAKVGIIFALVFFERFYIGNFTKTLLYLWFI